MPCDINTIQAYVTLIKDVITGLSALTAAIIAILGLQAWKKQLKGKTEYELAQKYLRAIYKIREAFAWVRNPYQSATGNRPSHESRQILKTFQSRILTYHVKSAMAVYQKRFQKVNRVFFGFRFYFARSRNPFWGKRERAYQITSKACINIIYRYTDIYLRYGT